MQTRLGPGDVREAVEHIRRTGTPAAYQFVQVFGHEPTLSTEDLLGRSYPVRARQSRRLDDLDRLTVLFLHVPQAGGNALFDTMRRALRRGAPAVYIPGWEDCYGGSPRFWERPEFTPRMFVTAHYVGGLHELLPSPSRYLGLLRDPERVFWSYFFTRWNEGVYPPEYDCLISQVGDKAPSATWDDIERKIDAIGGEVSHFSFQLHELARLDGAAKANHPSYFTGAFEAMRTTGPDELLAQARANVQRYFFLVGITELFEETVFAVCDSLGVSEAPVWAPTYYSYWKPKIDDIPTRISRKLRRLLDAEISFYWEMREAFENDVAARDFSADLWAYKEASRNPFRRMYLERWFRGKLIHEGAPESEVARLEESHWEAFSRNLDAVRFDPSPT